MKKAACVSKAAFLWALEAVDQATRLITFSSVETI